MLALARLFLSGYHDLYVGLVLYGLAPCIAMVIVFTFLAMGNSPLAIVLVAVNSIGQMLLIPIYAKLLLGNVSFDVLVVGESVLLYLGIPLLAGFMTRRLGIRKLGEEGFKHLKTYLDSLSIIGLLFTLIVMFALKGDLIIERPMIILQMAVPMTLFFWVMFAVVYLTSWKMNLNYEDSVAVAFNSTGRDFEIAIAIAITAFSPAVALATVVGPLIEVPVMLALVWAARKSKNALFERIPTVAPAVVYRPAFNTILFPTDFSPHADRILDCISELKLAGMKEAVFLHVINPMKATRWLGFDMTVMDRVKAEAERLLKAKVKETEDKYGISVKERIEYGIIPDEIIRVADEENAELIVMGSHGRGYFKGALLGSNTQKVMRRTGIPLMIVRFKKVKEATGESLALFTSSLFKKVLYPTDFSQNSLPAFEFVKNLDRRVTDEITVMHVQDKRVLLPHLEDRLSEFNRIDSERLAGMEGQIRHLGFKVKTLLKTGYPSQEINTTAEKENVSLIVLGSHGRSAVEGIPVGSVADTTALTHIRPVLIVPKDWKPSINKFSLEMNAAA